MTVFEAAALHVLSADIEDEIDVGAEMGGCFIMGYGFDFAQVDMEGFLQQEFAISCNA